MKIVKVIVYFFLSYLYTTPDAAQNAQWVNPFIGTDKSTEFTMWGNYGGTFPGAVAPWGMVQLSPETSIRPMEVGYYYSDSTILSFSCHSHLSGYPNGSSGKLHLSFWPSERIHPTDLQRGRLFSHAKEVAQPGYYAVTFPENDRIEMTATVHNGLFRYHSSAHTTTLVITQGGKLTQKNSNTIESELLHSILRFDKPISSCTIHNDTAFITFKKKDTCNGLNIWLSISKNSFVKSEENARQEICQWDFDAVKAQTYATWNQELQCVQVNGGKDEEKTNFYTALYHACLQPTIVSDVTDKEVAYGHFSPWDTFRTLHPMLSLLKPERQGAMIAHIMNEFHKTGRLPKGPMTGFHIIPIFLDAAKTNATNIPANELLDAAEALLQSYEPHPIYKMYRKQGYISANQEKSVSITSELAYNDWALSQLATLAGDTVKTEKYANYALNYRHLFDVESGFLLPKDKDRFLKNTGELGYQESDRWTCSYFVPHNVQDLINRLGGDDRFALRLEEAFATGKILFDNEPIFHYPYLFTWAGRPDLTCSHVHQILSKQFHATPGGITGNDDLGSMSSWYVLSAIGLFPACPGSGEYILSEPLFDKIKVNTGTHTFTICKKGKAPKGTIPSILIDGKEKNQWALTHRELMNCQEIMYDGATPKTDFSALKKPISCTKDIPSFELTLEAPVHQIIQSGSENFLPFQVKNTREEGLFVAQLKENGKVIAEKTLLVESQQQARDTIRFTGYKVGKHSLELAGKSISMEVRDSANRKQPFVCLEIKAPCLLATGKELIMRISLQNIAGKHYKRSLPILVNKVQQQNLTVDLQPGEMKEFSVTISQLPKGMQEISLLQKKHQVKVFDHATDACLLQLEYDKENLKDLSGFENHPTSHGALLQADGFIQTDEQAFLTLPTSHSLMAATEKLTLLTWIAPEPNQGKFEYADFFTKGDYTCLKMEGPNTLVFFAGGWGRGTCEVKVPNDWYGRWHLVAGVCTGSTIQLYIDGELKQEIAVQGKLATTEVPWNIGRNAEMPFSRFWKAKMAKTRIYGAALSPEEIQKIYNEENKKMK